MSEKRAHPHLPVPRPEGGKGEATDPTVELRDSRQFLPLGRLVPADADISQGFRGRVGRLREPEQTLDDLGISNE